MLPWQREVNCLKDSGYNITWQKENVLPVSAEERIWYGIVGELVFKSALCLFLTSVDHHLVTKLINSGGQSEYRQEKSSDL